MTDENKILNEFKKALEGKNHWTNSEHTRRPFNGTFI